MVDYEGEGSVRTEDLEVQLMLNSSYGDPNFQWRLLNEDQFLQRRTGVIGERRPFSDHEGRNLKRRRNDAMEEMSLENRDIIENLRMPQSTRRDRLCRLPSSSFDAPNNFTFSPFTISSTELPPPLLTNDITNQETDQSDFARYRRYVVSRRLQENRNPRQRIPMAPPEREGFMGISRPSFFGRHSSRRSRRSGEFRLLRFRSSREEQRSVGNFDRRNEYLRNPYGFGTDPEASTSSSSRTPSRFDVNGQIRERSMLRLPKRRRKNEPDEDNDEPSSNRPSRVATNEATLANNFPSMFNPPELVEIDDDMIDSDVASRSRENRHDSGNDFPIACTSNADPSSYEDTCNYYMDALRAKKDRTVIDQSPMNNERDASSSSESLGSRKNVNKFSLDSDIGLTNYSVVNGEPPLFTWSNW